MKHAILGACALALAACSATSTVPVSASNVTKVQADVQLFCQIGSLVSAVATASGSTIAPVIAKGASSAYLQAVCAAANAITVSPPADANSAPVLVIPAVSIPLKS